MLQVFNRGFLVGILKISFGGPNTFWLVGEILLVGGRNTFGL